MNFHVLDRDRSTIPSEPITQCQRAKLPSWKCASIAESLGVTWTTLKLTGNLVFKGSRPRKATNDNVTWERRTFRMWLLRQRQRDRPDSTRKQLARIFSNSPPGVSRSEMAIHHRCAPPRLKMTRKRGNLQSQHWRWSVQRTQ